MDHEIVYENKRPGQPEDRTQQQQQAPLPSPVERKQLTEAAAGGSTVAALCGAVAAVLVIISLAAGYPWLLTPIAAIVLGGGLFAEGLSLSAALAKVERMHAFSEAPTIGGFALQGMAGAGAVALGIIALAGVLPGILIPIAVLTIGGAMAFGGPARAQLNLATLEFGGANPAVLHSANRVVNASGGLFAMVGLAGVTLGILALTGVPSWGKLSLVGILTLGAGLFLVDSVLAARSVLPFRKSMSMGR